MLSTDHLRSRSFGLVANVGQTIKGTIPSLLDLKRCGHNLLKISAVKDELLNHRKLKLHPQAAISPLFSGFLVLPSPSLA